MKMLIQNLLCRLLETLRQRWHLQLELLALRHQLEVMKHSAKRPRFEPADRWLWVLISKWWSEWPKALDIMQADTVRRWQRQGIWHHLKWKRGRRRPGRPPIADETRKLIREMSQDNQLWGSPRIRGELLKLDIKVSQTTVAKYMIRRTVPPSPTWRTFICNQTPEFFSAEVYAELSAQFQSISHQAVQLFRQWVRWLYLSSQRLFWGQQEIICPERIDPEFALNTSELASADLVNMSGRGPPDTQSADTNHTDQIHTGVPTVNGMVDVHPNSSVTIDTTVLPPRSTTLQSVNLEPSIVGSQQAAA